MLEEFKNGQPIVYKIFCNAMEKNKLSHAYLIETKGYPKGLDLALSFAKSLLCPNHYVNLQQCQGCTQCSTIDDGNFTEIKIIQPDGLWIKKEQLTVLQNEFSKKALIGNKKIYIIHGAEYLNSASANSILKFLEEPEENIIAILIAENANQVLDTIVSRCQLITLAPRNYKDYATLIEKIAVAISGSDQEMKDFINNPHSQEFIEKIINFVDYYEKNGQDVLLYMQKLWFDQISDKEKMIWALQVLLLFYKDILNQKCERFLEVFDEYQDLIIEIAKKNTMIALCHKMQVLLESQEKILLNVNLNLLMDQLIIQWEGGVV